MIWLRTHASMRESMASVQQSLADSQGMRSSLLAPDRVCPILCIRIDLILF